MSCSRGGLQGRGASPDTLKMLLCLPRRRCQLHQQLPQSRLLGVHQGHWGSVARGRGRLQSGWKAQKSDRNQGWGLGGTGLGTSLLWVALAAASSELIHVLCKLRFLLISRAVPGGVWPRVERVASLLQPPKPVGSGKGLGPIPGWVWGASRLCWRGRLRLPGFENGREHWASRSAGWGVPRPP